MTKKEIAQDFLKLASKGESREAFQRYVGNGFKHHNVFFKGDAQTLITAMEENARKNPDIRTEIHHVLEEGAMVAIHSHVKKSPDDLGAALMQIFRFDNEKIVELWDFGQAVPADMVNENGMF